MSRRQQLLRPHRSASQPPAVPVFWVESNQPGQIDYYVDANPGTTPNLYRIQYSTSSAFEVDVQEVTTLSTGYHQLYLPPGVEYFFQARAERDELTSPWTGVTGAMVPALSIVQTNADEEFAYVEWSPIPAADSYAYDIDGMGFNSTSDTTLSIPCVPGQTVTLTVQALQASSNYGNSSQLVLYGLPYAPSVSLAIGSQGGGTSVDYEVIAPESAFSDFEYQLGYYNEFNEFQAYAGGTLTSGEAGYFSLSEFPELLNTTMILSAQSRLVVSDTLTLASSPVQASLVIA